MNYFLAIFFLSWTPLSSSVALYQQCGGEGYRGATNCDPPLTCFRRSRWYSSCQSKCPGGDWECATQPAGSAAATNGFANAWEQCGGEGWKGPRACAQYPCQWRTKWYAQCRPDCPAGWQCQGNVASSTAAPTSTANTAAPSESVEIISPIEGVDGVEAESVEITFPDIISPIIESVNNATSEELIDDDMYAAFGREMLSRLLGDGVPDSEMFPMDLLQDVDLYDAVVDHIVAIVEAEEPGSLARFGAAIQSDNVDEVLEALENMHARTQAICAGSALLAAISADPLFADSFQSDSFETVRSSALKTQTGYPLCDGPTPDIGKVNGKYGRSGKKKRALPAFLAGVAVGAATEARQQDLARVDSGEVVPDPESRLGAYAATAGYGCGTIGEAMHVNIGAIYVLLGTGGEEAIGRVFNNPSVKATYCQPVNSALSECLGRIELRYWQNVNSESSFSFGGLTGARFSVKVRDIFHQNKLLQRTIAGGINTQCPRSKKCS